MCLFTIEPQHGTFNNGDRDFCEDIIGALLHTKHSVCSIRKVVINIKLQHSYKRIYSQEVLVAMTELRSDHIEETDFSDSPP